MKLLPKNCLKSLLTSLMLLCSSSLAAEDAPQIQWNATFQETQTLSKKENKPIFLYFSGSDWCSWCNKLDEEILSSPDFITKVGPQFVFYKADFPVYTKL